MSNIEAIRCTLLDAQVGIDSWKNVLVTTWKTVVREKIPCTLKVGNMHPVMVMVVDAVYYERLKICVKKPNGIMRWVSPSHLRIIDEKEAKG